MCLGGGGKERERFGEGLRLGIFAPGTRFSRCSSHAADAMAHLGLELKDLFQDLRFPDTREHSVARIQECYKEWLAAGPDHAAASGSAADSGDEETEDKSSRIFVGMIPAILNLSLSCPHRVVREGMAALLVKLRAAGKPVPEPVHRGVSHFIPDSKVVLREEQHGLLCMYSSISVNAGRNEKNDCHETF